MSDDDTDEELRRQLQEHAESEISHFLEIAEGLDEPKKRRLASGLREMAQDENRGLDDSNPNPFKKGYVMALEDAADQLEEALEDGE